MTNCSPIPPGHDEASVVAAIESVSRKLARAFSFGSFTPQDIAQEVALFSMELLRKGKYDPAMPLQAYLMTHARRRLCNMKRNLHHRSDSPCARCAAGDHCCEPGPCKKHAAWAARNLAKATLNRTVDLADASPEREPRTAESVVEQAAERNELAELLDRYLDVDLRADYKRMLAGEVVIALKRRRVQQEVARIMAEHGFEVDGLDVN